MNCQKGFNDLIEEYLVRNEHYYKDIEGSFIIRIDESIGGFEVFFKNECLASGVDSQLISTKELLGYLYLNK